MSITKSYNKHTGIYYAYETTYQWNEQLQKTIQRKRCIGHFDPETNEIIQNGRRGRPTQSAPRINSRESTSVEHHKTTSVLSQKWSFAELENFAQILTNFGASLNAIKSELDAVEQQLSPILSKLSKYNHDQ